MSEHVLGTGQKQTLRNILRLTEAVVVRTEGPPREMRLWTEDMRVTARRPDYTGDYESFRFVFRLNGFCEGEAVEKIAERVGSLKVSDGLDGVLKLVSLTPAKAEK